MLRVLQMTVPFFSVVIFSGHSWCSCFDRTDSYLRLLPTDSQTTVPFFRVVIFPVMIVGVRILTQQTVI